MLKKPIITLLSDFGTGDPYVGVMKGVILSISPHATIVDITHGIRKFDIRLAAFLLFQTIRFFPEGSIHIAVVDPGVGTKRRPIIIETERSFYVGPDNGILMLSAQREKVIKINEITNPRYVANKVSYTFHGRDIFSPIAAHLANGIEQSNFGPEITDPEVLSFIEPTFKKGHIKGEVLHIDRFGNIVTNIKITDLEKISMGEENRIELNICGKIINVEMCKAYSDVPLRNVLAIFGSSNFLEVSINQGDASKILGAKIGDNIIIG